MAAQKIKSMNDLEQFQQDLLSGRQEYKARVLICATGCRALGAQGVAAKFREKLQSLSLDKQVHVVETGCIGMCAHAPVMLIEPYEYLYGGVSIEDIDEIISTTIQEGQAVERLAVVQDGKSVPGIKNVDFYKKQTRLVLENCGRIDPRKIEDAIERGAYLSAVEIR